ncbi:hypothetical protein SEA_FUNSIZED_90 [Mycobacterium phage Funsized]|nr:hypothetical protein SEA_FUNSIZED_90 [Mycobacterium phage Funsized]
MTTTIAIVTGTADRKGPALPEAPNVYPVIPGRLNTTDMQAEGNAPVFDTMICLADGSISAPFADDHMRSDAQWHTLRATWCAGTVFDTVTMTTDRIAVIDLDNADGREVLRVINWVNHIDGADLP